MSQQAFNRHRRLRGSHSMRNLVRETKLSKEDLIYPLFVVEGQNYKKEVPSMPGVFHYSLDLLDDEIDQIITLGIESIILFGVPKHKDDVGTQAYAEEGIVQQAIRQVKANHPQLVVIADTCLCQYTDHGHCGVIQDGTIENDQSLSLLVKTAVSQARAGADVIAPSNMMDALSHQFDTA